MRKLREILRLHLEQGLSARAIARSCSLSPSTVSGYLGPYVFDGYTDGTTTPAPTAEERVIPLSSGETFPPIKSAKKAAWWKLQRIS